MQSQEIAMAVADAIAFDMNAGNKLTGDAADKVELHRPYPKQQSWFDIEIRNVGTREIFRVSIRRTSVTNNVEQLPGT